MKKRKAFTLMETVVTIVIYAVMLLMITNIVLMNARLSQQLKVRSRIRTEMAQMVSLIKRDIRNATSISSKDNNCMASSCEISVSGQTIKWYVDTDANGYKRLVKSLNRNDEYTSGDYVLIDDVSFSMMTDATDKRVSIILTIKTEGKNSAWKVTNQVAQEIISTRNYQLGI